MQEGGSRVLVKDFRAAKELIFENDSFTSHLRGSEMSSEDI
jgi:hypothetical protein